MVVACNGETVPTSGNSRLMFRLTDTPKGSIIASVSVDYHFSGIGSVTGAKYEGSDRYSDFIKVGSQAAVVFSVSSSTRLIGQGKVSDTWLDFTTKFTFNANGEITHRNSDFKSRCS